MDRLEWWRIINISLNSTLGGLNSTLGVKCSKEAQNKAHVSKTEDTSTQDCWQPVIYLIVI